LRNVRWTIAMSRTSIGCAFDIYLPPSALQHCYGLGPPTTISSFQAAEDRPKHAR
jgi:hypothetical protein